MIVAIRWSSVSYFISCMWSLWQHRLSAAGCWGNKASFQPQVSAPWSVAVFSMFSILFFPTYPSLPALKSKPNVSHTTDFCTVFFHTVPHTFLMWFADRPNPSGASVKWEVVFSTQHLHISVQIKPKEEMNAMLTSDSTPELDKSFCEWINEQTAEWLNSCTLRPVTPKTQIWTFAFWIPSSATMCMNHRLSPGGSPHCLLFFPLQRKRPCVALFAQQKHKHLILQIYSPPPLHDQHFKCSLLCKSLITSVFQKIICSH